MLDVGFSEILLTSAIALIVLGPERLPKVARQLGNWMGRARAMARQLSEQLEREVSADELLKTQDKPKPNADLPASGAAFDTSYTPAIAPPPATAPPPAIAPPAIVAPTTPRAPHPTSAEAMHAADRLPPADTPSTLMPAGAGDPMAHLPDPQPPATDPSKSP
jgi:Tat protein translocase TatB subunit